MKNCLYCGQPNPEENQFCNKCGKDIVNYPSAPVNSGTQTGAAPAPNLSLDEERERNSINYTLYNGFVKAVLYIAAIFVPVLGLILSLLISVTPFWGAKELSAKLIRCACIASIVWFVLGFVVGFIGGFLGAL